MKNHGENNDRPWAPSESPVFLKSQLAAASQSQQPSSWWVYLLAIMATLVTLGVRLTFANWFGHQPRPALFLIAVILCAYLGGLGPGLLATTLATFSTFYVQSFLTRTVPASEPVSFFLPLGMMLIGILMSVLSEGLLRARRRAEASERLQAVTLASIGDGVITTDTQRQITFLNAEAERLTGWTLNEALGKPLLTVFRVLDEQTLQPVENLVELGDARLAQRFYLRAQDGREISIEAKSTPIRLTTEAVVGVVVVFRDQTERKRAEVERLENEERLRLALSAATMGIWEWNLQDDSVYWSPECYKLVGLDQFDSNLTAFRALVHPEDLPNLMAATQRAIETRTIFTAEFRVNLPNGRTCWFTNLGQAKYNAQDEPLRVIGISQDITERKQAEAALRESELRFRTLAETASDVIITMDGLGKIIFANAVVEQVFGYNAKDLSGQDMTLLMPEYKRTAHRHGLARYQQTGVRHLHWEGLELSGLHRDGHEIPLELSFGEFTRAGQRYFTGIMRDITERKRAEEELRKSETHFRALFEGAGVGNVECDAVTGQFVQVNQKMCELTGYTAEELLTRNFSEITHPDDRDSTLADYQRFITQEAPLYQVEKRYVRKDGSLAWVSVTSSLLLNEAGRPWRTVAAIQDITERKRAEEALQFEKERLEKMAMASPLAMYSFHQSLDGKTALPYASAAFYEIFGLTPAELAQDAAAIFAHIHPADIPRISEALTVSARTLSVLHESYRYQHPHHGERWFESYAAPILEPDGNVTWHGIANDITERQQAEAALRESEERFRMLADNTPVLIWMAGLDMLCTYFNRGWLEFTGRPLEAEIGAGWAEGIHPDDLEGCLATYETAFAAREVFELEYRLRRADGEYRWLLDKGVPRWTPNGDFIGYIGSCVDITERRQSEQALLLTQNQLRQLATHLQSVREEERTTIAREIHDDLGQMLTAMKFNLKWVAQSLESDAADAHQRVANTIELVSQTIQIVRRLATSLHPSILDDFGLPAALEWQITEFQKHSGIRCRIEALPQSVTLERNRALALFRICQETLTNVARHAAATEISLSLQEEQENIWLRIHDNGCGIAVDALAKRRSLGLISMRERALSLGGEFSVQGAPGLGTTVTVRIPMPNVLQPTLS